MTGPSREVALYKLARFLGGNSPEDEDGANLYHRVIVQGPPNNLSFLRQILNEDIFRRGEATTQWIDSGGVTFTPRYELLSSVPVEGDSSNFY